MGIFINKGNPDFQSVLNGEYVDKSGLITVVNRTLFTEQRFSCVTRCRRFGKSMAAKMLCAYYDSSCDSRSLFAGLEAERDASFEKHLNKYPVLYIDMTDFITRYKGDDSIVSHIDREVRTEVHTAFPDTPAEEGDDLMALLLRIVLKTQKPFFFIIDEWDAICREFSPTPGPSRRGEGSGYNKANGQHTGLYTPLPSVGGAGGGAYDSYVNWLRRMFKSVSANTAFAGVYMTGILPIKKYSTQSALNNFIEYSMVRPGDMARYFGFTRDEVLRLTEKHGADFDDLEKWYDGYLIGRERSMFNPNSVMQALREGWCQSYWSATGSFEAVTGYINLDYEGLRSDIVHMLAGDRSEVNPKGFLNDLSEIRNRDDVLTALIHLGYLTYDRTTQECYIPNLEVSGEMESAVNANNWEGVTRALKLSRKLLEATLRGDSDYVAARLEEMHSESTSILEYNDENSLSCTISIAYYYARNDFQMIREMPTGKGYADIVLLPRKHVNKPALVIELEKDRSARAAIDQIKDRHYPQQVAEYTGDILLVAINYDTQTKQHTCQIERWVKE